jgi:hypothetical protein
VLLPFINVALAYILDCLYLPHVFPFIEMALRFVFSDDVTDTDVGYQTLNTTVEMKLVLVDNSTATFPPALAP